MSKGTETKEAEVMKNDAGTVGSAPEEDIDAVVDAVMKKYDRESNTRVWEGKPKLIVSIVWFLGTFAVDALGLLLSGMLGGYEDIVRFRFAFTFGAPYSMPPITQAQAGWLTVGVVVLVVLCGLALCLMTYAAMAIGQSFKKNKGLMSVVFFFVLWIGTRLLLALIFGAFYGPATSAVNTMTVLQALWTVLGCACVGALAFCVGFFFLTHGMLRKHLNLQ